MDIKSIIFKCNYFKKTKLAVNNNLGDDTTQPF